MGLMDVLNGMQHGPRGDRSSAPASGSGGMSPMTMAILGLLAYKALKHFTSQQPSTEPSGGSVPPSGGGAGGGLGGGLGGVLGGLLGGAAAGTAGSVLSGGLGDL